MIYYNQRIVKKWNKNYL